MSRCGENRYEARVFLPIVLLLIVLLIVLPIARLMVLLIVLLIVLIEVGLHMYEREDNPQTVAVHFERCVVYRVARVSVNRPVIVLS